MAPLGILVNLTMMLFLPLSTWLRLVIWLGAGLVIYLLYSRFHSRLTRETLIASLGDFGVARVLRKRRTL